MRNVHRRSNKKLQEITQRHFAKFCKCLCVIYINYVLKIKIILRVFVSDAADYFLKSFIVGGIFALVNPLAYKIAEYSSEILVTGIGNERTAVGKHSDES